LLTIDAHQHAWDPARVDYPWLGPELAPIDGALEFAQLAPLLAAAGVDRTVMVQSADNAEDTAYLFETAAAYEQVAGVVGWVPLTRPAEAAETLSNVRENPVFVGVRHLIHEESDPDWLLRPDVDEGFGVLEQAGVTFDIVSVLPQHLGHVPLLGERHPNLRMVIDHLSKPPLGTGDMATWRQQLRTAAENPNVYAKISGLYPVPAGDAAQPFLLDQLGEAVDFAVDVFGADRLMYGGDWPISVLFGGYEKVWKSLAAVLERYDETTRAAIFGGTAVEFYRLAADRLPGGGS